MSAWTCKDCGKVIHGLKPEHCPVCCETFTSTRAGDRHRTGDHGVTDGPKRRRCRPLAEMFDVGLEKDSRGYWRIARSDRHWCTVENLSGPGASPVPEGRAAA